MTRFGWIFLGLVVLVVGTFASMTQIGGPTSPAPRSRWIERLRPARPAVATSRPGLFTVPVLGVARAAITDTWGQARGEGRVHHGTDIMAPGGTPVVAAAAGTVEKLFQSRLGGTTLYVRSRDRLWTYYYAHLAGYAAGLHENQVVRAGDRLGFVGDTGDAGPGNYHLHFGLERLAPGQRWWQGEEVNPYPLLAGTPPRR